MRPSTLTLVVVLVAAPAAGAAEGDLDRLQGTWVSGDGPTGKPITLEFKGRTVTVSFIPTQGDEVQTAHAEISLDEAALPKAMDWIKVVRDGRDALEVHAIYALQGDTLKLRTGRKPGGPRPAEFLADPKAGAGEQMVFRRRPAEPKTPAPG
ncbi:MAG TPA: TIGR03067 domain-containing protein [Isosphaeraceae bacterium]|jgi:uncharacterized protein (TIGR03067 family)